MTQAPLMEAKNLSVTFHEKTLLKSLSIDMHLGEVLAVIGPAGSGKSTLLRVLNRMIDLDKELRVTGELNLGGQSILGEGVDVVDVRRRVGVVFSVPITLPMSIYDNLAYGPRLYGLQDAKEIKERIEKSLKRACIWDEVKDRQNEMASNLSGGQQQRLCLARTLMVEPEMLLLDEPCSGLDPISTAKIEEALTDLKKEIGVVLVTNNVKQASRVSDRTAFLLMGELVELDSTRTLFTTPKDPRTEAYITGRFG